MKKPSLEQNNVHLIVKNLTDKPDLKEIQDYFNKQELGITIYLAAYEIGKHKDKHVHCYCTSIYTKRYYNDHLKHPDWKFRFLIIQNSQTDIEKVISYLFKDGDDYYEYSKTKFLLDYRLNTECSLHGINIYKTYKDAKNRKEKGLKPNKTPTEEMIEYFIKMPIRPTKKEILKEIIKMKKEKKLLIQKTYLKNLLVTILAHLDPKYERNLIEEIASEV